MTTIVTFFFPVTRTFKNYSLSNFQIKKAVLLTDHHVVHCISRTDLFCNWKVVPFDYLISLFCCLLMFSVISSSVYRQKGKPAQISGR